MKSFTRSLFFTNGIYFHFSPRQFIMRGITAVAFCLLVGAIAAENLCKSRGNRKLKTPDFPQPGSECFKEDFDFEYDGSFTERMRPVEALQSCSQYVRCDQTLCRWKNETCEEGLTFDQKMTECMEPGNSDCAAALFGPNGTKVIIENLEQKKVLDDCQGCLKPTNVFPKASPLVGNERSDGRHEQQALVGRKLGDSQYYSLAFDRKTKDGDFKVLTDMGRMKAGNLMFSAKYDPDHHFERNIEWEMVPTDTPNIFRIRNPHSQKCLAMSEEDLAQVLLEKPVKKLVMREYDLADKTQLWKITKL